jgi:methylglyoxal reductase
MESRMQVLAMVDITRPIVEKHELTLAQLVIACTIAQISLTHALVGARNPQESQENAAPGNLTLSREELENLSQYIPGRALAAQEQVSRLRRGRNRESPCAVG